VAAEQAIPTASGSGSSPSGDWATAEAASTETSSATEDLSPEAQLDRLLRASEPVFLFFHSNTCVQCVKMTGIVEEVYPDFSDSLALVDVDVYDERNKSLLQRANIRAIPTLIFVDREGEVGGHVGVMEPDALREQLRRLGEE
jgi:thiol:disulfide interchange protein